VTGENEASATSSGQLVAYPAIVRSGETSRLFWNVENVEPNTCLITGTDAEKLTGKDLASSGTNINTSGAAGLPTSPITAVTTYNLSCTGYDGSTITSSASVQVAPIFNEQ